MLKSDLFRIDNGDVPELFKLFIGGKITVETMHILNEMTNYIIDWEPVHSIVWNKEFLIIKKLKKFVKFDIEKLKEAYNDI